MLQCLKPLCRGLNDQRVIYQGQTREVKTKAENSKFVIEPEAFGGRRTLYLSIGALLVCTDARKLLDRLECYCVRWSETAREVVVTL